MGNHCRWRSPTSAAKIAPCKSSQQQFGLVQPGGIARCKQDPNAWSQVSEEGRGLSTRVAGTMVHDQGNALSPSIRMKQAAYRRTKVFTVILVQTFCPHPSIEQREPDEQIDRAVTVVLKFVTFNLSRSHRLFGAGTFQNLDARFFVNGNDHYPLLPQESNSLVIPVGHSEMACAATNALRLP